MEVLISMFVLAIGLMGVAALIPAGRHEIVEGMKLENSAMVGRAAFRDLQVRGYLNPANWRDVNINSVYDPANPATPFVSYLEDGTLDPAFPAERVAFAIDPLGLLASAGSYTSEFPWDTINRVPGTPIRTTPLHRILPIEPATADPAELRATFDTIFRSSFDQITDPNTANKDLPPTQKYFPDGGGAPVRRASNGNYSWLATIVSDPMKSALDAQVTVSVAVFYKRNLSAAGAGEYISELSAFPVLPMTGGGEAILNNLPTDPVANKPVSVKPGQWIMLAGRRPLGGGSIYRYRWYRVLSAAQPATSAGITSQRITLAGHDWNIPHTSTRAWIFDNIVSVYEKNMPLEIE